MGRWGNSRTTGRFPATWSVNRKGGKTGRANQESHVQDHTNLPSLVWPNPSTSQMEKVVPHHLLDRGVKLQRFCCPARAFTLHVATDSGLKELLFIWKRVGFRARWVCPGLVASSQPPENRTVLFHEGSCAMTPASCPVWVWCEKLEGMRVWVAHLR